MIAFAVMMLFCCGGLGRLFSKREPGEGFDNQNNELDGDAQVTSAKGKGRNARRGGFCH
ncbi:MAG: hypothetical protein KDA84_03960 [Planctomycetaceae bacterium]|nr:hypothetical protein [Planctomycetaceae bacterium]